MTNRFDFPLVTDFQSESDYNVPCKLNSLDDFFVLYPNAIKKNLNRYDLYRLPFIEYDEYFYYNDDSIYKFTVNIFNNNGTIKFITNYYYIKESEDYKLMAFLSYLNEDNYKNSKPFLYYLHEDKEYIYYFRHVDIYSIQFIANNYIKINETLYKFAADGTTYKSSTNLNIEENGIDLSDINLPDFTSEDEIFDYIANTYFTHFKEESIIKMLLKFVD